MEKTSLNLSWWEAVVAGGVFLFALLIEGLG
jgi:hypothetical protein